MADELIPDDVRDFILRHIDSIAQLEALLLRANADDDWNVEKMTARLYTSEQEVTELLARLCEDGYLTCEGRKSHRPAVRSSGRMSVA